MDNMFTMSNVVKILITISKLLLKFPEIIDGISIINVKIGIITAIFNIFIILSVSIELSKTSAKVIIEIVYKYPLLMDMQIIISSEKITFNNGFNLYTNLLL